MDGSVFWSPVSMPYPVVSLKIPEWVDEFIALGDSVFPELEDRMRLVVTLARENAARGGGPFGRRGAGQADAWAAA